MNNVGLDTGLVSAIMHSPKSDHTFTIFVGYRQYECLHKSCCAHQLSFLTLSSHRYTNRFLANHTQSLLAQHCHSLPQRPFVYLSSKPCPSLSLHRDRLANMKATFILASLAASAASLAVPITKRGGAVSITPHDKFSSSIGVLGCKINTDRVAYFPSSPNCDGMCIKVSANGRSVNLLHIDTSGGAFDIAYDAWNYLKTGQSATENPVEGGGFAATYENVDMSECADHIHTPKKNLAFSAPNSIGYVVGCPAGSWVGQNHALYNIQNSACTMGADEICTLDLAVSNQPSCPSLLGSKAALAGDEVWDVAYGTGKKVLAA